jgi:hypothetical protein
MKLKEIKELRSRKTKLLLWGRTKEGLLKNMNIEHRTLIIE